MVVGGACLGPSLLQEVGIFGEHGLDIGAFMHNHEYGCWAVILSANRASEWMVEVVGLGPHGR